MPTITQTNAIHLSALTAQILEAIQGSFFQRAHWVIAEVSNHSFYPGKDHHYFELVEKGEEGIIAKLQGVAWRNGAGRIRQFEETTKRRFTNHIRVCVKVNVEYHPAYGLKLIVLDVDPSFTLGQIELQRLQTINRLLQECPAFIKKAGERFVTRNNQLSHQRVIQRIAVVSSSASAGLQDFMKVLIQNQYGFRFTVNSYYTAVQGEANADNAKAKLEEICASAIQFDAVVIIRGGGADTDFLLFDQFALCAAVAALPFPVITGIGHTKNQSLVDMLAHTNTISPTEAAKYIIAHNLSFERTVLEEQNRIIIKSQQLLAAHKQDILYTNASIARKAKDGLVKRKEGLQRMKRSLSQGADRLSFQNRTQLTELSYRVASNPKTCLSNQALSLKNLQDKLSWQAKRYLQKEQTQIGYFETLCRMMSPVNILKKGFALVYKDEKIIVDSQTLKEGEQIKVRLLDTEVYSTITQKTKTDGDAFNL